MAKRKRRPGSGSKLKVVKNYQDPEYTPYIFQIESGILMAWALDEDIRDGDVRQTLRHLIKQADKLALDLQNSTQEEIDAEAEKLKVDKTGKDSLLEAFILSNLKSAYKTPGPLNGEDLAGVLKTVNYSLGSMNRGMRGQEYLKYIQGFMGHMGAAPRKLTPEEVESLGLDQPENTIEGDYDEIK